MGLVLDNIRRSFGAVAAVDGASLEVAAGEIVCLFGPSGCGKTTLLRIAGGFERHDGAVRLDGATLADGSVFLPPEKRPVGFVFQDFVLFPHLTAAENVAFGLSTLPAADRKAAAARELAAVGLDDLGARFPHELSGGQQQRVALARAFARKPRAMLLDEPFASIDPALRLRLREDLRLILKSSGAAAVLVTHDAEEALSLGDRVALMREGRIVETATPEDLYFRPRTIDAAMMHPGAQAFDASRDDAFLAAAIAPVEAAPASRGATIVALPGALSAVGAAAGAFRALDCRFSAPGWTVVLQGPAGAPFRAAIESPVEAGDRFDVKADEKLLRIFPA